MILARHKIVARLRAASVPVAIHDLNLDGVSQTSASARLRELAREGVVQSVGVPGKRYTAWILTPADLKLHLSESHALSAESGDSTRNPLTHRKMADLT